MKGSYAFVPQDDHVIDELTIKNMGTEPATINITAYDTDAEEYENYEIPDLAPGNYFRMRKSSTWGLIIVAAVCLIAAGCSSKRKKRRKKKKRGKKRRARKRRAPEMRAAPPRAIQKPTGVGELTIPPRHLMISRLFGYYQVMGGGLIPHGEARPGIDIIVGEEAPGIK
jgi:hypothetical protein